MADRAPLEVPPPARKLAEQVAALLDRDQVLCVALNDAQDRLSRATDRLTAGLSAEAIRSVWGPAALDAGLSGRRPPVLADEHPVIALEDVAQTIRSAFVDCQHRWEERRQLAFDVGEASERLQRALVAAGFTTAQGRAADVRALARGVYVSTTEGSEP